MTTIPLTPRQFRPHLATIREALAAQHVYWVDWKTDRDACNTDICLDAAGRRPLWAITARQIMQRGDGSPVHPLAQL